MSYGNPSYLPRIHNFNEAVSLYESIKGVRGRENIRPLKTNRRDPDTYKITAVRLEGEIVAVQCWLYDTPVLVYKKDELRINGYNSRTTNMFIDDIAPHWLRVCKRDGHQVFHVKHEGEFLAGSTAVVVPVDENYYPIKGAVQAAELNSVVLNKTRASDARKSVKDVVELARVTSKVDGYWLGLINSNEGIEDEVVARLRGILWAHRYRIQTFDDLKQHLYQAEYDDQGCYDHSPAEYGHIPNNWEMV